MIRQLSISHFKCFRTAEVPLRPLTILIGKNDTGKSTFLRAIEIVANAQDLTLDDRFRRDQSLLTSITAEPEGGGAAVVSSRPTKIGSTDLRPANLYRLPAHGVSMQSEGYGDQTGGQELGQDGSGVASLLDYFLRKDRPRFFDVVEAIKNQVPGVRDVNIATPGPAVRRLELVLDGGFTIPADHASAGVRLLLFFIALSHHPSPPKVILLEEPENGIHPKRLAEVMRLLKGITRGEHAKSSAQVILSTHSPYLLDSVNPDEDEVLIFQRLADGSRTATPADTKRLAQFLEEFMLGEVWFNQGEEGMVPK
jgi:predicted ATPase